MLEALSGIERIMQPKQTDPLRLPTGAVNIDAVFLARKVTCYFDTYSTLYGDHRFCFAPLRSIIASDAIMCRRLLTIYSVPLGPFDFRVILYRTDCAPAKLMFICPSPFVLYELSVHRSVTV